MKKETKNERIILSGQSKGVRKNITNPRQRSSPHKKRGLSRWGVAYVVGGLLMVIAAHYASTVISLGR
jgi:hypothetical protein